MTPSSQPAFRPCLVLPTYNNAGTLADILQRTLALGLPTYVIDDGSTDGTRQALEPFSHTPGLTVLNHRVNRGKAAAMRTAFAAAHAHARTHALTLDTDGQLSPEQAPDLLAAAARNPRALVLGLRSRTIHNYPASNRFGRKLSNLLIRVESGVRVGDSQCGMRVYPLDMLAAIPVRSSRYGYEMEVITRAAWAGVPILEVPVSCKYFPPAQRVSHYRPWLDTSRAVLLHVTLLARKLIPVPHPQWPGADQPVDEPVAPARVAAAK
jgi:glycosyltransferase involved in cell wall biosynthesis